MSRKILLVSDSPYATTGLGRMSKYFLQMLPEFEWVIYGQKHPEFIIDARGRTTPLFNHEDFNGNFKLYSPKALTGNDKEIAPLQAIIQGEKPDFLITSLDFDRIVKIKDFIQDMQLASNLKWINYFPVDRDDWYPSEVEAFRYPDVNVCITKFGVEKFAQHNDKVEIKQIYHPIDANEFPEVEIDDTEKQNFYKNMDKGDFILGTVNRSFFRKDPARLIETWAKYIKENPETFGYYHGSRYTHEGMDLLTIMLNNGYKDNKINFMSDKLHEEMGVGQEALNKIYRSFDLFMTFSSGEGFGFSTVEALLTGTPLITPDNTSFSELVQDFGIQLEAKNPNYFYSSLSTKWPHVDVDEGLEAMNEIRSKHDKYKRKALKGRKWVLENLNLETIAEQWREILK